MDPEIHWFFPAAPKVLSDHSRIYYTMLVWAPVGRYISHNSGLGPSWPGYILQFWFEPQLASIYLTILVWAPVGQYICSIYLVISGYMINKYAVLLIAFEIINYFIYDSEYSD